MADAEMGEVIRSTLNTKLGKVSQIGFTEYYSTEAVLQNLDPSAIINPFTGERFDNRVLDSGRVFYDILHTGNSDKYKTQVGFKQPSSKKDPYQVQYRLHWRYTPAVAKKKSAEWTAVTPWKNFLAFTTGSGSSAVTIDKGSTVYPDVWLKPNLGVNKNSDYVVFGEISGTFSSNYDALSCQFRVRTYNQKSRKHGLWEESNWLKIYKSPRCREDLTFYAFNDGSLVVKSNIKYGERGGVFEFSSILDNKNRNLLKKFTQVKMVKDTARSSTTTPQKVNGFVPASCRIPLSALKRGVSQNEVIWLNSDDVFVGNDIEYGRSELIKNAPSSAPKRKVGVDTYRGFRIQNTDVDIDPLRLVLKPDTNRALVQAWVYKSDADDLIDSLSAVLWYTYKGKNYSIKPHYVEKNLKLKSTTKAIGYYIFIRCPLGIKLAVKATASNSLGQTKTVKNAITLPSEFWYIQKEGNVSLGAVLQWNVNLRTRASYRHTMELPYGRTKPFVAYGNGLIKTFDVTGEVPTQTKDPLFNTKYASKDAWRNVQNNPGVYIVRGPDGVMYRMAITEVSLEEDAKTEILKVSFSGTEID